MRERMQRGCQHSAGGPAMTKETHMKRFIAEFKEFINKGNLLGIAIGFVIGVAVAAMVESLVDNVIMPIVAIPFGKPNFDQALIVTINDSQIRFGAFLSSVVSFLAIAFTVFWILKAYNKVTKGEATAPANEAVLLRGILDEIKGLRADNASGPGGPGLPPPPTV
jgi:large conductance mechanosensitive channel